MAVQRSDSSSTVREGVVDDIVTAIAERTGSDPLELPPLYHSIDPDVLAALFASTHEGDRRTGEVGFRYAGFDVTVSYDYDGRSVTLTEDSSSWADEPVGNRR